MVILGSLFMKLRRKEVCACARNRNRGISLSNVVGLLLKGCVPAEVTCGEGWDFAVIFGKVVVFG